MDNRHGARKEEEKGSCVHCKSKKRRRAGGKRVACICEGLCPVAPALPGGWFLPQGRLRIAHLRHSWELQGGQLGLELRGESRPGLRTHLHGCPAG